jgi:transposase
MKAKQVRARYTRKFKLEAVRQVNTGQNKAVVAKVFPVPKASLGNWLRRPQDMDWQARRPPQR